MGRCGLVVASRACFPCKKSHPDPRTTRNFRHFREDFKQDSVRRLGRHFRLPNTGTAFGASLRPAPTRLQIRFPNTGTVFEASLKSASMRLQIRFRNTGTVLEASLKSASKDTWDFKILNGRVTMRNRAGSATGHAMQPAEF